MEASPRLVVDLTLVVAGGLLGAIGARSLRLPVIAGYLIAGVALGPSGFKVLRDSEIIGVMAEVGVALLMFAIGVELSLGWLSRLKRAAFVSAPVQIVLTGLGASSVDWVVRVWVKTSDYWPKRETLTESVKKSLDKAGIGIPFPQMDVHLDQPAAAGAA